ncbi:DUF5709 domain-containing protein [Nakamurella deserti]|uniref:DUF5709 domain-containing protein n=1 Tax=Nakamurella deserti TaxID=2164074 RepID=UPI0013007686|nr:DUF5709 domain-containing protein [Nakamurella deserti]
MSESADANESFEVGTLDGTNPELSSNDGGEDSFEQSVEGDPVYDMTQDQVLDQGYSPPDYEPKTKVPTEAEEAEGLSLDELLAAEEPDVDVLAERQDQQEVEALEVGDERAGRLVDIGDDGFTDTEKAMIAEDDGIAGGGATAEEAAMHVFDPEGTDRY